MAGLLAYLRVGCLLKDMLSSMACVADALHEIYSSGSAQVLHLIPFLIVATDAAANQCGCKDTQKSYLEKICGKISLITREIAIYTI